MLNQLWNPNRSNFFAVHNMGWAAMDYKIGRLPFVPMDTLSFATYHKAIRENILKNDGAFDGHNFPRTSWFTESDEPRDPPYEIKDGAYFVAGTQDLKPSLQNLSLNDFIDYVFLSALGRRATDTEKTAFIDEGLRRVFLRNRDGAIGWDTESDADNWAEEMLDYISRLPEFYYYRAVNN